MLDRDLQPDRRLDQRRVHVSLDVPLGHPGIIGFHMLFAISIQSAFRAAHRDNVCEAIAALDAHVIRDGSEAMRRIGIAVAQCVLSPVLVQCMVRRLTAREKLRDERSLRQCIRPLGGEDLLAIMRYAAFLS